jgi:hypothetical protein
MEKKWISAVCDTTDREKVLAVRCVTYVPDRSPDRSKKQTSYRVAGNVLWRTRQRGPAQLAAVATEAEAQGCTNFRHSERTELRDPPSQAILSHGHDIVQIYGTVRFHAIVLREENLGRHTANRGRDRRHSNSG